MYRLLARLAILFLSLSGLTLSACGGGGGASPAAVSPGVGAPAGNLVLWADKVVATPKNSILMQALLTDGNGKPVVNQDIVFGVTSGVGSLSSQSARTNAKGVASVYVTTVISGVSLVSARSVAFAGLQDTRVVYFSESLQSSLILQPDANHNAVYGEAADYSLTAEGAASVALKSVFRDITAQPAAGKQILFGSDSNEISFDINPAQTDRDGVAYTTMAVANTVRERKVVTVFATELSTGAADIISLQVFPATTGSIVMSALSYAIDPEQTTTLNTCVLTAVSNPVADGTIVRYAVDPPTAGTIDNLFGSTTAGCDTATFTAMDIPGAVNITATSGGVVGTLALVVTTPPPPPPPQPQSLSLSPNSGSIVVSSSFTVMVTGGTPPYTVIASSSNAHLSTDTVFSDGGTFSVSNSIAETVTISVRDAVGKIATGQITFTSSSPAAAPTTL